MLVVGALATASVSAQEPVEIRLEDGLRMAFRKNEILGVAQGDLDRARQGVRHALAGRLPQISVDIDYLRNFQLPRTVLGDSSFTTGTKYNLDGSVTLRQSLYSGGRIGGAWREARDFLDLSREALREVRKRVHAEVETGFYDVLLAAELIRVGDLALDRARRNLRQVQLLRDVGRASGLDLIRAEVQVLELAPDSIRARHDFELAEITFKNSIGLDPAKRIRLAGEFRRSDAYVDLAADSLVSIGLANGPDRRQLDHRLAMRRYAVQIKRSGHRPNVDFVVSGQMQIQGDRLRFDSDEARRSWYAGFQVSIPLFDGFRTSASVAQARIDLRRIHLETTHLERRIRVELRRASLGYGEARDREAAQKRALKLIADQLQAVELQYKEGAGTQLEVMDAQLDLLRTETEYARARRDRAVAIVELEYALGVIGDDLDL